MSHRSYIATEDVGPYRRVLIWRAHRWSAESILLTPTPSRKAPGFDIPDASLSHYGVCARRAVGKHDNTLPGRCAGSVLRRSAVTRAGGSVSIRQHNRYCRDHSGDKCVPAYHSAGSGRADRSARTWPALPTSRWTARREAGIKGPRKLFVLAAVMPEARGWSVNRVPGLRLCACWAGA